MAPTKGSEGSPLIGLPAEDEPHLARMLGITMALASEVFVLKAEVRRLTDALRKTGKLDNAILDDAGRTESFDAWMAEEQKAFAAGLLKPWLEPDAALDPRPFMTPD